MTCQQAPGQPEKIGGLAGDRIAWHSGNCAFHGEISLK
jgi:hypothetical protein